MRRIRVLMVGLAVAAGALPATAIENAQAAGSVKASVSLTAPSSGAYGSAIKLTGRLWRTGTSSGLSRATVWLQRSAHAKGRYANLRSTKTSSSGGFSFSITQTGAYDYRVTYGGSAAYTKATSPTRYPVTTRKMLFDSIATTNWETGGLKVTGRAVPAPPNGTTVTLQVYSGGKWVNLASGRTTSGKVTINTTRPGSKALYRIVTGARYPYGAGTSAARSFTHYKWRGAYTKPMVLLDGYGRFNFSVYAASADPTLSKAFSWLSAEGFLSIRPSIAGCLQARSTSTNTYTTATTSTAVRLSVDGGTHLTSGTLGPGAAQLALGIGLAGASSLDLTLQPVNDLGFYNDTKLQLRCAN